MPFYFGLHDGMVGFDAAIKYSNDLVGGNVDAIEYSIDACKSFESSCHVELSAENSGFLVLFSFLRLLQI